ncbi:MAG: chorismate synthase [Candidatus Thermoplasmatota archaeon]|nr:chorismate synthase [Candidatus Thermoplasmatota archaeon]
MIKMNTIGEIFKVTLFGESHGYCVGVVIDNCPPGLKLDEKYIEKELAKRRPKGLIGTERKEEDKVKILSGIFENKSTGAPITIITENKDLDSSDYELLRRVPRPGHADITAHLKYRGFNDYRSGGMFSGRLTASLVMAGAVAKQLLSRKRIEICAHTVQIGNIKIEKKLPFNALKKEVDKNRVRCADQEIARKMEKAILEAKASGDTLGGIVECIVEKVPIGLGEPFFDSVESEIAKIIFSIPGVKGIEFGSGFKCAELKGSEHNDKFKVVKGKILTLTNNAGGLLGGLTNGMPIVFRIAFKPPSSIKKPQSSVNYKTLKEEPLVIKGRHDVCIAPRACVAVEGCTAIALADLCLRALKF